MTNVEDLLKPVADDKPSGEDFTYHEALLVRLLGLALIQAALMPRLLGLTPNLLLLLTICQALIAGPANAARWAFYAGLALDLSADTALGLHALALLAAVLVIGSVLARFSRGNWLLPLVGVVLGSLAYHAVLALLTALLVAPISPRVTLIIATTPYHLTGLKLPGQPRG